MKDLKQFILDEMEKLHDGTGYWGSEEQIQNEIIILKESGIEMEDKEAIEEWYYRVYHAQPGANPDFI